MRAQDCTGSEGVIPGNLSERSCRSRQHFECAIRLAMVMPLVWGEVSRARRFHKQQAFAGPNEKFGCLRTSVLISPLVLFTLNTARWRAVAVCASRIERGIASLPVRAEPGRGGIAPRKVLTSRLSMLYKRDSDRLLVVFA